MNNYNFNSDSSLFRCKFALRARNKQASHQAMSKVSTAKPFLGACSLCSGGGSKFLTARDVACIWLYLAQKLSSPRGKKLQRCQGGAAAHIGGTELERPGDYAVLRRRVMDRRFFGQGAQFAHLSVHFSAQKLKVERVETC